MFRPGESLLPTLTLCASPRLLLVLLALLQVHRAVYRARHPVAVKMLTDPGLRCPDRDTLKSFR